MLPIPLPWLIISATIALFGTYQVGHHYGWIERDEDMQIEIAKKNEMRMISKSTGSMDPFEQFKAMYKMNPQISKTTASEILEVSRKTIHRWVTKLEGDGK